MIINRSATLLPLPEPLEKKHKKTEQWTFEWGFIHLSTMSIKLDKELRPHNQNKAFISTQRARQLYSDLVPLQRFKKKKTDKDEKKNFYNDIRNDKFLKVISFSQTMKIYLYLRLYYIRFYILPYMRHMTNHMD